MSGPFAVRTLHLGAIALSVFFIPSARAQSQPDPAAVVESQRHESGRLAAEWLASPDPRIRAWGAYVVLRDRRRELLPTLLSLVSAYDPTESPDKDQHDAMLPVLDALIQLGIPVPESDAAKLFSEFPAQSLILLSRAPQGAQADLLNIFRSAESQQAAWLAAGNLLASQKANGFAAAVLGRMTIRAHITLADPMTGLGAGFGGSCACGGRTPEIKPGWPEAGGYSLSLCTFPGAIVLAAGMDTAYYHRGVDARYSAAVEQACGCPLDLDLARQHYLAQLLYAQQSDPPLEAHVYHSISWAGDQAYRDALEAFVSRQQGRFASVAQKLQDAGLLTADEASLSRPRLRISISDQRSQTRAALPPIGPLGENVSFDAPQ